MRTPHRSIQPTTDPRERSATTTEHARGVSPPSSPPAGPMRGTFSAFVVELAPGRHPDGRSPSGGLSVGDNHDDAFVHQPVLVDRIVDLFAPVPPGWVVDATLGGAGHAVALLEAHPHLRVLGLDQDTDAIAAAAERLALFGDRAVLVHTRFDALIDAVRSVANNSRHRRAVRPRGELTQLDRADRGFSYRSTRRSTCAWTAREHGGRCGERHRREGAGRPLAQVGDERFASGSPAPSSPPAPCTPPAIASIVRAPSPLPPAVRRPSGQPHLSGHPDRRQRRAADPPRSLDAAIEPLARRAARRARVPLR